MEYDRYKYHPVWYIIGTVLYLFALGSFALGLYLIPYFFLKISYNIPEFIVNIWNIIKNKYEYTDFSIKILLLIGTFIASTLAAILAKIITKKLDPKERESKYGANKKMAN
jgi:hypothetical protein